MITSSSNPQIKAIRKLRRPQGRRKAGRTLVEGPNAFAELVVSPHTVDAVVRAEDDRATAGIVLERGWNELVVSNEVLASVTDTSTPQGPLAVIPRPEPSAIRSRNTVVLVDVADPGNVGTIARSAAAFGWDVAVTGATADPWSPKAIRASAGLVLRLSVAAPDDPVSASRDSELTMHALVVEGGAPPHPEPTPIALFVGSEAHGLSAEVVAAADRRCTIPMPGGAESLNVGVAASLGMYALS